MGTPTQVGTTGSLVELPGSPVVTYGELIRKKRSYRGVYSVAEAALLTRGTAGSGDEAGFLVAQSVLTREKGNVGLLEIEWEAGGATSGQPLPADKWWLKPFNTNPKVSQFPSFETVTRQELSNIGHAVNGGTEEARDDAYNWVITNGSDEAIALMDLMVKGAETYYLAGLKYVWEVYSYTVPSATQGGFVETPGGPAAGYLPGDMSWLRECDDLDGSSEHWYKLTRTWVGGPSGHWDGVLYPGGS